MGELNTGDSVIVRSQPLHEQVYDFIKKKIIYGEVKSGTKIVESQLSRELHISRGPIREAFRMLCADELLLQSNEGIIVNPMDYQTAVEAYECRIIMDPYAARLAAERIDEETLDKLKECLERTRAFKGKQTEDNYQKIIRTNSEFHALIIYACRHHQLQRYIENNMALISLARINEFYVLHQNERYIDEHEQIYQALYRHDAVAAQQAMYLHDVNDLEFYKKNYEYNNTGSV